MGEQQSIFNPNDGGLSQKKEYFATDGLTLTTCGFLFCSELSKLTTLFSAFQCNKDCGGGKRYRKVRCQQRLALGEVAQKPDGQCPFPKPRGEAECNRGVCKSSYDYEKWRYETASSEGVGGVRAIDRLEDGEFKVKNHKKLSLCGKSIIVLCFHKEYLNIPYRQGQQQNLQLFLKIIINNSRWHFFSSSSS